ASDPSPIWIWFSLAARRTCDHLSKGTRFTRHRFPAPGMAKGDVATARLLARHLPARGAALDGANLRQIAEAAAHDLLGHPEFLAQRALARQRRAGAPFPGSDPAADQAADLAGRQAGEPEARRPARAPPAPRIRPAQPE